MDNKRKGEGTEGGGQGTKQQGSVPIDTDTDTDGQDTEEGRKVTQ